MKSDQISLDGEVHLKMLKLSLHLGGYDRPGVDGWGGWGRATELFRGRSL
jgi:hypothetical protein